MNAPLLNSQNHVVRLDIYQGPIELLMYLVRRGEIDPLDLSLAKIARQFQEYVEVPRDLNLESIGDFVVLVATLAEMKSRLLLPVLEEPADASGTPEVETSPSDLVLRLLQYKRYKDASLLLEKRAAEWQERYGRMSSERPVDGKNPAADVFKEVELWDLVSALARVLRRNVVEKETRIRYDDVPISVLVSQIGTRVREVGRVEFSSFFEGTKRRARIVSVFMAILELMRHHGFRAEQTDDFGEIWILPPASASPLPPLQGPHFLQSPAEERADRELAHEE